MLPLTDLLADLDREQLVALLLGLAERDPDLVGTIVALRAGQAAGAPVPDAGPPQPQQPLVDIGDFRRRVGGTFRGLRRISYRDSYAMAGAVAGDVWSVLGEVKAVAQAGDGRSALLMLEAVIEGYADVFESLDDSDGDGGEAFEEAGRVAADALLSADLTSAERTDWGAKLASWQDHLSDYGLDDVFRQAQAAAEQGWDYPPLQRILRGEAVGDGEGSERDPPDDLISIRLNILERQGRTEEYMRLAAATGQAKRYAIMLARLGRAEEAVGYARAHVTTAPEVLELAQALRESSDLEGTLAIAEWGLALEGRQVELANWLRELAAGLGRGDLALTAALVAFRDERSLAAYQHVQSLAGENWPGQRAELLDLLRQATSYYPHGQVDIFLYEGLLDDAIAAVDRGATHELVERVVDAALATHPDWAIDTSRRQAESIMDAAKAQYYAASAGWLRRARTVYLATNRAVEWQDYLQSLLDRHRRKRNLVPLLTALR